MRRIGFILTLLVALALPGAAQAGSRDRDHDRLPDKWEKKFHISTHKKSARQDIDKDGLSNLSEYRAHTSPRKADTDGDDIPDNDEDRDHDRVDNGNEQREHTNPAVKDSNHNRRSDGREDRDHDGLNNRGEDETGNDPIDHDTDNDGVRDGNEQAGVIASFANNVLTINLGNNRTVQGTVDASTRITCESEDAQESHHGGDDARTSREPESGGNSGPGGGGSGDDGPNHDQGDDDGADDGPNHDQGDDHGDDAEGERNCSAADLTAGTRVHEAEAHTVGGGLVFEKVELLK